MAKKCIAIFGHTHQLLLMVSPSWRPEAGCFQLTSVDFGAKFFREVLQQAVAENNDLLLLDAKTNPVTQPAFPQCRAAVLERFEHADAEGHTQHSSRLKHVTAFSLDEKINSPKGGWRSPEWVASGAESEQQPPYLSVFYLDLSLPFKKNCVPTHAVGENTIVQLTSIGPDKPDSENLKKVTKILAKIRKQTSKQMICVLHGSLLQLLGFRVDLDSSWERFALDCQAALRSKDILDDKKINGILNALEKSDKLVIRGAPNAAFVRSRTPDDPVSSDHLLYIRKWERLSPAINGFVPGCTAAVTLSIACELLHREFDQKQSGEIDLGIPAGIERSSRLNRDGYCVRDEKGKAQLRLDWHRELFNVCNNNVSGKNESVGQVKLAQDANEDWSLLRAVMEKGKSGEAAKSQKAMEIARYIVQWGLDAASVKYGIPVAKFGDRSVVDRHEFERFCELQHQLARYRSPDSNETKPISIAVFGSPGSGKSYSIEELAKSASGSDKGDMIITANLSQFTSVDELAMVFQNVRNVTHGGQVPLVLLDEFDTAFEGCSFGWLKHFLAPMQDGTFRDRENTFHIGKAILAFVGGVNHNYAMLDGRLRNREFIEAKGPDFVSRLQGYMDVLGIDPTGCGPEDQENTRVIRRAILLRRFLKKHHKIIFRREKNNELKDHIDKAHIDEDIINAFLRVESFKHGVRSMGAIVKMCHVSPLQRRLHKGVLPTRGQMQMHVDYVQFWEAVQYG